MATKLIFRSKNMLVHSCKFEGERKSERGDAILNVLDGRQCFMARLLQAAFYANLTYRNFETINYS